ncbi:MAG: DUF1699 family protein [Methanolobus sp.]|nr:DUF1699 family protein [Methanolobus sp.]
MKIRIVNSKEDIDTLEPGEEIVYLSFRPSNEAIFSLVLKCPKLKTLLIPPSYKKTVSKSIKMYLEMHGIALIGGDMGTPHKDIDEYSEVSQRVYDLIDRYRREGLPDGEIEAKIGPELSMGPDLIRFILKNRK